MLHTLCQTLRLINPLNNLWALLIRIPAHQASGHPHRATPMPQLGHPHQTDSSAAGAELAAAPGAAARASISVWLSVSVPEYMYLYHANGLMYARYPESGFSAPASAAAAAFAAAHSFSLPDESRYLPVEGLRPCVCDLGAADVGTGGMKLASLLVSAPRHGPQLPGRGGTEVASVLVTGAKGFHVRDDRIGAHTLFSVSIRACTKSIRFWLMSP